MDRADIWPREKLDTHVKQRMREYVDIAIASETDTDGETFHFLREGGEQALWRRTLEAIAEAVWKVVPNG